MSQATNQGDTSVSPNAGDSCDYCNKPIDANSKIIFVLSDVIVETAHPDCYADAVKRDDSGNDAHFSWPPEDSDQHDGFREFLGFLQERVETLPPTEETQEPNEPSSTEAVVRAMSYAELIRIGSSLLSDRTKNGSERSELEELIQDEIVRRDEKKALVTAD